MTPAIVQPFLVNENHLVFGLKVPEHSAQKSTASQMSQRQSITGPRFPSLGLSGVQVGFGHPPSQSTDTQQKESPYCDIVGSAARGTRIELLTAGTRVHEEVMA